MPGISYDDSGALASYFGVTFLAVLLFPATYWSLRPSNKDRLQSLCDCSACRAHTDRLIQLNKGGRWRRFSRRILPLLSAWLLFVYLCYNIASAPRLPGRTVYNPFEILGLSDDSTEKAIKKHFKKLSLQFHPDKIKLAVNQTQEDADSRFVELTKAYKSLTDEVTRDNLVKYGNPDGPQQREDKIAIPRWVVEGKNSFWVLGLYGLVLGGAIPYVVGRWWFSQRRLTRDGILNDSAEIFFHQLRDDTDFVSLVALLASAAEVQAIVGHTKKGGKKEKKDRQAKMEDLEGQVEKRKEELGVMENPLIRKESRVTVTTAPSRRARAILWAHLLRIELGDTGIRKEQVDLLKACPALLTALLNISLSHNWMDTTLRIVRLQACLVQALPDSSSPLAQLPDITPDRAVELEITKGCEGRRWLEKWAKNSDAGSSDTKKATNSWPRLEVTGAEFKVAEESLVTPSSIVQLSFRCRYLYPTSPPSAQLPKARSTPNGDAHENGSPEKGVANSENGDGALAESVLEVEDALEAVTDKESDIKEGNGDVKEKVRELKEAIVDKRDTRQAEIGTKAKLEGKKVYPPNGYAHAPYWPMLRKPHYQVLLVDTKLDKVIVQPIKITDIPLPRPDGLPSDPREFQLQFQAPPQANLYSFVLRACSDTYLGADVSLPLMLKVEDPPAEEEEEEDEDEDISEPDEDTLAGQMAMMRGGKVKPSAAYKEDESEYETSSDEEGPRGKRAINEDSDSDSD